MTTFVDIYHGGTFSRPPNLEYIGGMKWSEKFDCELLSVPHLAKKITSFGYLHEFKLLYKFSNEEFINGLTDLRTDKDVIELIARISFIDEGTRVEVYVEHGLGAGQIVETLPAPTVEGVYEGDGSVNDEEDDEDFQISDFRETDDEDDDMFWSNVDYNVQEGLHHSMNYLFGDLNRANNELRDDGRLSDYANSDDLRSLSDSDEDDPKRTRYTEFNETTNMNNVCLKVRMIFTNHKVFREALREYALKEGFDYDLVHNDRDRVAARCKKKCGWNIWASSTPNDQVFRIKTFSNTHNCGRHQNISKCSVKWLCNKYMESIRDSPNWDLKAFQQVVKREHKICVSKVKCYRAKKMVMDIIVGKEKEQYSFLWDYCNAVLKWNPGSTVQMRCDDVRCFQRLYICLDACKKGFLAGCRPIIGLDACHLKGGLPGQLLCAVGKDANDNIFPIAYAVCEAETKETWTWFVELLTGDIGYVQEKGWTFISDRQKGLVETLKDFVCDDDNRFCIRHMYNNFNKDFKGKALKDALWNAARATTDPQFQFCMAKLKELDKDAYEWACKEKPQAWSRHAFNPKVKCDMVLNNVAETFNSYISNARNKPIITMFEMIRILLMKRFHVKREGMRNMNSLICPRIQKKLEFSKMKSVDCVCEWGGPPRVEVDHCFDGKQIVDLDQKTCTCRRWDLTGIPCSHACAAIYFCNLQPEDFVDNYFKKETFMAIYEPMIHPMPGPEYWPKTPYEPVLPPEYRRKPGRPKRVRRREPTEPQNPFKINRAGTMLTCGNCGKSGHNARSCKGVPTLKRSAKMKAHAEKAKARRDVKKSATNAGVQTRARRSKATKASSATQSSQNQPSINEQPSQQQP